MLRRRHTRALPVLTFARMRGSRERMRPGSMRGRMLVTLVVIRPGLTRERMLVTFVVIRLRLTRGRMLVTLVWTRVRIGSTLGQMRRQVGLLAWCRHGRRAVRRPVLVGLMRPMRWMRLVRPRR